jgi:hypothetical protein
MCLYLTNKGEKEHIAQKPIVCYKILQKNPRMGYITPFKGVEIKLGKVYRAKGDGKIREITWLYNNNSCYKHFISEGYIHTFCTLEGAKKMLFKYGNGYAIDPYNHVIVQCTIPTGAKYYKGVFEETRVPCYASTSIRYWKMVVYKRW